MPRRAAGLTAAKVRTAMPGRYGDGRGLYLLVRSPEARFWVFRYRYGGRAREAGLGSVADVGLAEARDAAEAHRKALRAGMDPLAERKAEKARQVAAAQQAKIAAITFDQVADAYIQAHEAEWRNPKHRQQWRNTIAEYASPVLGGLPVAAVDLGAVMRVLEPIWREKPETASRLRGRIESVLDYATVRGLRSGDNPARWRGHLDNLLPRRTKLAPVEHHAALPWQEMGGFMAALTEQTGVAALALRFAILTASRTGEALGATWGEIDLQAAAWTIPASRMKAGREHRIPLSDTALAILREARALHEGDVESGTFVFPGAKARKPLSNMSMLMLLRRMERDDLTAHGFRSTFRDWAGETTAYAREVIEHALAHQLKDRAEAAYARGDLFEKRRRLMADWAAFCGRVADVGTVTPLRVAS